MKHLPKIVISTVPHKKQRYDTCGDYFKEKDTLNIRLSHMNADHEFLVLIHELIEWYTTQRIGVTIEEIDRFDMAFEKNRKPDNDAEPGDDENAPYYVEHQLATIIEKFLADYLHVNWEKYDKHVKSL